MHTEAAHAAPRRMRRGSMILLWTIGAALLISLATVTTYRYSQRRAPADDDLAARQAAYLAWLDRSAPPGRVVFLGSSTFQALDAAAVAPAALNLSIGGDTTHALLARARDYHSLAQASAVWLNIGFNDLMQRCAIPHDSFAALFSLAPSDKPLFVLAIQNVSDVRLTARCQGRLPTLIDTYNDELASACGQRPGCRFVAHPVNTQENAALRQAWTRADGIHLNPAGYAVLIDTLHAAMRAATPSLARP